MHARKAMYCLGICPGLFIKYKLGNIIRGVKRFCMISVNMMLGKPAGH